MLSGALGAGIVRWLSQKSSHQPYKHEDTKQQLNTDVSVTDNNFLDPNIQEICKLTEADSSFGPVIKEIFKSAKTLTGTEYEQNARTVVVEALVALKTFEYQSNLNGLPADAGA